MNYKKINQILNKIIVLIVMISLSWAGSLAIKQTFAYFSDIETSLENTFSAGTLDFSLEEISNSESDDEDDEIEKTIQIKNRGSISFQYTVRTEKILGDDAFCQALQLKVEAHLEENKDNEYEYKHRYNGNLLDFRSPIKTLDNIDTWYFEVFLSNENSDFQNKACNFKFVFDGWQIGFDEEPGGFFDTEKISNTITMGN